MSDQNLAGKRVLITHADQFMGPAMFLLVMAQP